ncbi:hypothetical protein QJQ45_028709 [Haematococcus lacustris]|nr:hypothetical protein QJQ45_028709 [Haematococcus lacustris]
MSFGRLHAFVIATKAGEVVYERFWDRLSEVDKAEARAALQLASSSTSLGVDDQDFTGSFRSAHFTFIPYGELVYYLVGSGEYDELACADIIRQLVAVLSDILGKLPTVSLLMDKYVKLVVIVDEIINEDFSVLLLQGLLECLDKDAIRKAMKLKEAERLVSELKQELQGQNACIAQLQHSSESNNESNSLLAAELELQLQAKAQLMRDKARLQQENMLLWSERQLLAEQLGLHPADCSESNSLCQALSEQMQAAKRGQLAVKQLEGVIAYLHEALVLGEGQHTDWQVSLQGLVCALCSSTAVMEASSELQPGPSSGLWLSSSITHCSLASSLRPAGSDTSHHSCMLSQHQGEGGGTLLGPGRGPASDSECSSLKTWRSSQSDVLEATHAVERRTACMTQLLETHAAHQHLSHSASRGSCESDASEGAEELEEEAASVSQHQWGTRKQLVVFFGNAGIGTRGGWGANAVLQACRKVVERPDSGKPTDRVPGKVVTVDEFRTSRVSAAMNSPQPCEEELDSSKPTRPED